MNGPEGVTMNPTSTAGHRCKHASKRTLDRKTSISLGLAWCQDCQTAIKQVADSNRHQSLDIEVHVGDAPFEHGAKRRKL